MYNHLRTHVRLKRKAGENQISCYLDEYAREIKGSRNRNVSD